LLLVLQIGMKTRLAVVLIVVLVLVQASEWLPRGFAANYSGSFELLDHFGGSTEYRLNVAISQSLQDYYAEKSHTMNTNRDFAKFVTPYAVVPIANCLGDVYHDDEDFVNGALSIVHQISYEVTVPSKFPVETLVDGKGDCDLFSYIAASIIKAKGLNAVLLYYEGESHMNVGVSLSHPSEDARENAIYVTNDNVRYYVAECTGGNWQTGWRVGECPDTLEHASVEIITLEDCEQTAPGQVSASYHSLASSTVAMAVSPSSLVQGGMITLAGQLTPAQQDETVTIYIKTNGMAWTELASVTTDSEGRFSFAWVADTAGIGYVRASWSGDNDHAGADSPTQTVTVLSTFFIALIGITVVLVAVGIVVYVASRRTRQEILAPQPPEIPT